MLKSERSFSKEYLALAQVRAVIEQWDRLSLTNYQALLEIGKITLELQRQQWEDNHSHEVVRKTMS